MPVTRHALALLVVFAASAPYRERDRLLAQATPPVAVSVVPDSLALQPGRPSDVIVVVRNTSTKPLRNVRLSWFTNSRIEVTSRDTVSANALPAGGTLVARLSVVGREQSERDGSVIARVDYMRETGRDVAFKSITVRPASIVAPDEMLDVQINASLATLTERQNGALFLVLKNKADVPLTVESITVTPPSFLEATKTPSVTIAPKSVATIPVTISVKGPVRPGKHQVLLDLPVKWAPSEAPRHLILAREVEVGVLGESAILAALGVPSFLVLPGFLMVLAFATLWKWRVLRPPSSTANLDLSVKEPEFWLLAITLSGMLAVAYPYLTSRDYLDAYDVGDVARIWLLSTFVLGAGSYFVTVGVLWLRHAQRTPRGSDQAGRILEKVASQGLDLRVPCVKVGGSKDALALQPQRTEGGPIWVGPRITWEWTGDASEEVRPLRAQLEQLTADGNLQPLVDALRAREKENRVKLRFEAIATGGIARPQPVEIKDVTWSGSTEPIVSKQ